MKKLNMLLLLVLFTSCTMFPNSEAEESITINGEESITINTDTRTQYQLKQKWIAHTASITRGSYSGNADLWGGGSLLLDLWFENGDLWDAMLEVDNLPYVIHTLLTDEASFVDEYTAIMAMAYSASPKLAGNLYIVRLSNETIYRTKSHNGFNHINKWDGKTVNTNNLIPIAQKK